MNQTASLAYKKQTKPSKLVYEKSGSKTTKLPLTSKPTNNNGLPGGELSAEINVRPSGPKSPSATEYEEQLLRLISNLK